MCAIVIVPVFERPDYARLCMEGVERFTDHPYRLISLDHTNDLASVAEGDYVVFLDNDSIVTDGWLRRMVQCAESASDVAMVAATSNHASSGPQLKQDARYKDVRELQAYAKDLAERHQGDYFEFPRVSGPCVLVKRKVMDALNLWNEAFRSNSADDVCLRVQRAGYRCLVARDVYIHSFNERPLAYDKDPYIALAREKVLAKKERPLVSVIIPTRNRPDSLAKALRSALEQSYNHFEILVVNDGGVDVGHVIAPLNRSNQITYLNLETRIGQAGARNVALKAAKGKYVAYLDDDDIYYPNHLETLISFLETTSYKAAYTDAYRSAQEFDDKGNCVAIKRDVPHSLDFNAACLLVDNYIPLICLMHERHLLDQVGCFDESLDLLEDWELFIRMAKRGDLYHIDKVTCEFSQRLNTTDHVNHNFRRQLRGHEMVYAKHPTDDPEITRLRGEALSRLAELAGRGLCSVIIPVFNKVEYTRPCLDALMRNTAEANCEIIVVDNGSTDGTKEFLKALGNKVKVITNKTNLGFAKACNQGAAAASGEYLVFLNNDTVPLPGWLPPLVQAAEENPCVAVVGSKLIYPDETIQHAGVVFSQRSNQPYHIYRCFPKEHPAVNRLREFSAVTAACMLVKRDIFFEVGLFDEQYINAYEDADLCLKIKQKGYRILYTPQSVLYHYESVTEGRKDRGLYSKRIFQRKWSDKMPADEQTYYAEDGFHVEYLDEEQIAVVQLEKIDDLLTLAKFQINQGRCHQAIEILEKAKKQMEVSR